jgi:histidyl-tRNA synthetase
MTEKLYKKTILKPSLPKGVRDFSPTQTANREYLFGVIKKYFKLYGFLPIETPAMENLSTLTGKYGDEGDQLIFKIINSGDYLSKIEDKNLLNDSAKLLPHISEKALRYDLTVPFARYVSMNRNDIEFPFKRYQIQPVWRADRPQKGRYREFYQCDADIVGSTSLLNEVEIVNLIDDVFAELNFAVSIKINNRKILNGIAEVCNCEAQFTQLTVIIDKLDKIGIEGVKIEFEKSGFEKNTIGNIVEFLNLKGTNAEILNFLNDKLQNSKIGMEGCEELKTVVENPNITLNENNNLEIDITLARGLNYYTGSIFEVKNNDARSDFKNSISGGGRYDDLTGIFGLPDTPGVGISFGADRIYDIMEELNLFPSEASSFTKVLFVNFGENEANHALMLTKKLRQKNIAAEVFPDNAKMKKQMNFANKRNIPFVALIGESEINNNTITLKNMQNGTQETITFDEMVLRLS